MSRGSLRRLGRDSVIGGTARVKAANEALRGFKDLNVAGGEASVLDAYGNPSRRFANMQASIGAVSTVPRFALEALAIGRMVLIST